MSVVDSHLLLLHKDMMLSGEITLTLLNLFLKLLLLLLLLDMGLPRCSLDTLLSDGVLNKDLLLTVMLI